MGGIIGCYDMNDITVVSANEMNDLIGFGESEDQTSGIWVCVGILLNDLPGEDRGNDVFSEKTSSLYLFRGMNAPMNLFSCALLLQ